MCSITRYSRREYLQLSTASVLQRAGHELIRQWRHIAADTDGSIGAAALDVNSGQTVSLNGDYPFPLASVCKLPIGMRLLSLMDNGHLQQTQEVEVLPSDVWRSWPGDIGDRWPTQRIYTLHELLREMVSHSDNTAVQTLFRLCGERKGMQASFNSWGIHGFRVDRYEGECYLQSRGVPDPPAVRTWPPNTPIRLTNNVPQFLQESGMQNYIHDRRDTATPIATVQLLSALFRTSLLSRGATGIMMDLLEQTTTGDDRIRKLLPEGVLVADKTGTSASVSDLTGATNDVGLIIDPKMKALGVAFYLKASTRNKAMRENVIARLAKASFEFWKGLPPRA
jgi:beta-lactamase class A